MIVQIEWLKTVQLVERQPILFKSLGEER